MKNSPAIVWIDCEMTGLDPRHDEIIEIAVIPTDGDLHPLDAGIDLIVRPSQAALDHMNPFVHQMHTDSGLIAELSGGMPIAAAQDAVLDYVRRFAPVPHTAPLAGNTIGTDRMFLALQMPQLDEYLHYRNIDVSSLKELARRWFPRVYYHAPTKAGGHRALADIRESIEELAYYRATLIAQQPGPDRDQCNAAANAAVRVCSDPAALADTACD
ncbi:MAG: oligoribonuclease [Pseudoclavibacter sp.]